MDGKGVVDTEDAVGKAFEVRLFVIVDDVDGKVVMDTEDAAGVVDVVVGNADDNDTDDDDEFVGTEVVVVDGPEGIVVGL